MAISMKLPHIDKRANGRLRFRRRYPKDVVERLGEPAMQRHFRNLSGSAFQREYSGFLSEFEQIVDDARRKGTPNDLRVGTERWGEALAEAGTMLAGITGLEDDEITARGLLAEGLAQRGADPQVIRAVLAPNSGSPQATFEDAVKMYQRENLEVDDQAGFVRLERTCRRLADALGPLNQINIVKLRREHGHKFRDHLLGLTKADGEPLAIKTVEREIIIASAIITLGIRELDLEGKAANPFRNLSLPKEAARAVDKRSPLTGELIDALTVKLEAGRNRDMEGAWKLLVGTGCRLGEVAGLERGDLDLEGLTPCVHIRPNGTRRLKTDASIRSVPLVGETLEVVSKIVSTLDSDDTTPVFPRYARPRGSDALSAALNKHLRKLTSDKRYVAYGARHRLSDLLRASGAPKDVLDRILGHTLGNAGATAYGSLEVRLKVDAEWMSKALSKT